MPLGRLFVASGTMSLGYGSIFTLLAEMRDRFGFSETGVGAIAGVGFLAGFAAQVGLARFADRGHARRMVRTGLVTACAALVWMAFATELWQFVAARLVLGLGSGAVGPALRRVVIVSDPERIGDNLGRLAAAEVGGFVLGPLISGVLAQVAGLRAPFVFLAVCCALLLSVVAPVDLTVGGVSSERRVVRALVRRPAVLAGMASGVAFAVTLGTFESVWAVLLTDRGAQTWFIGVTLSLFTIPMVVLAPSAGRWAQRYGPVRTAAIGISIAIPCTFSYGLIGSVAGLLAVSLVHAFGDALTFPSNQVAVALASPREHLASAQGMYGAVNTVTAGLAAGLSATVYDHAGPTVLFTSVSLVMAGALAVAVVLGRELLGPPVASDVTGVGPEGEPPGAAPAAVAP